MNQFYQKEIGGVLGAILISASPVFASQRPGYSPSYPNNRWEVANSYQEGYSTTKNVIENNIEKNMYLELKIILVI